MLVDTKGKTAVVFSCAHAKPEVSNERFHWLSSLLYDIKPDYVVDLGDGADMCSLNQYDNKKPTNILGQNYQADISSYNDSQEKIRHKFRYNKKAMPFFIGFEGNHEHRIKVALEVDPRLSGNTHGISFDHLNTSRHFDEYHEYQYGAPAIAYYDGVGYAHYFSGGNYGRAISGTHHAYALLQNRYKSSTCGHTHKRDMYFKDGVHPSGLIGAVVGCFKGSKEQWAGQSNDDWWSGVLIKRELRNGYYEPEFISTKTMKKLYGENF